ncbi:MAG: phosphohistidine swiveling domain-containing protein [Candidatus Latescibacterota bacterium]|jgi:phosphohistidine swiveling domain-containing protein
MSAAPVGPPEPQVVPIPAHFPVTWDAPEEERLPWQMDPMHFPDAQSRLEGELWCSIYEAGMSPAFASYEMPVRAKGKFINNFHYMAIFPVVPPEEMEAQGKKAEEAMGGTIARLKERWEGEWLPEIKEHLNFWESYDLQGASPQEILAHYDETLQRLNRLWDLHFQIVVPVYVVMGLFDDLYKDLFEDEGAFSSYLLLGGFDNKTLEVGRALWDLSRKATAADVRSALDKNSGDEVIAALESSDAGQVFLRELRAFLNEYGERGPTWSLSQPSWIEDPMPVVQNLRDYIGQESGDPHVNLANQITEREEALSKVRALLAGYPQQARDQFDFLYGASKTAVVLTEDHNFWIDFKASYRVRLVLVEAGRRLAVANVLADANDVFYLGVDEVRAALAALPAGDLKQRVVELKATLAQHSELQPPFQLGTDYGPPPDSPLSRGFGRFFGTPPEPSQEEGVLNGHAGSPGKVRGTARIVRTLAEAEKLERGDILVTVTTAPPWTPLFSTAGAIVTDTGGILSHCAVVAREYRIPAVVGTGAATRVFRDGQILEVDGDSGTVSVVE